jgi:catechol 2,3-dioxygenase-like lactoylglutathione lyase family enzyme
MTEPTRRAPFEHCTPEEDTMATPQLGVIGIVVADMARSLAFYRQLGLAVPPEADAEPHVEAALPGGLRLVWDSVDIIRSFDPGYVAASGSARVFLAFKLDSPAAVDATYGQLVAAGYNGHLAPWDAFWGERYARIDDPDGNSVDLFADPATNANSSATSVQ